VFVDISLIEFNPNRTKIVENEGKRSFFALGKYSVHYTEFYETHKYSNALNENLAHRISSKSAEKYGK
jgi:hypothetical protein